MSGNQTLLDPPESGSAQEKASSGRATERKTMAFSFDKSYWSAGPRDEPGYCSQQTLFDDLGKELLDHGFAGFNACILACEFSFALRVDLSDTAPKMGRPVRAICPFLLLILIFEIGSGKSYRCVRSSSSFPLDSPFSPSPHKLTSNPTPRRPSY
jgi:kinesin family protein 1